MNEIYLIEKDAEGNSVIGKKLNLAGSVVSADGSIDEEGLKQWIEENYLKLTGGKLTGNLNVQSGRGTVIRITNTGYNANELPSENLYSALVFIDTDFNQMGYVQLAQRTTDHEITVGTTYNGKNYSLGIRANDSSQYVFTDVTPPTDAPNNAIYNKQALTRDFLPKSGGTLTGSIDITASSIDLEKESETSALYSPDINFTDKNNERLGYIQTSKNQDSSRRIILNIPPFYENDNGHAYIDLIREKGNNISYATSPNPRGLYNRDIVTYQSMVDRCIGRYTSGNLYVYVDANNGSDTADLNNGRGLSTDKPFKTLPAAWNWARTAYAGNITVYLSLLSDVTLTSDLEINGGGISYVNLGGNGAVRKITLNGCTIKVGRHSALSLQGNLHITGGTSCPCLLDILRQAYVYVYQPVQVSGTVTTCGVRVRKQAMVIFENKMTGSFTGKRYDVTDQSSIFTNGYGVNAIPGSTNGTVDSSSVFV